MTTGALEVRLLGDFDARLEGEVIPGLTSPRLQSLLGYLIVHRGRPVGRQKLAFLFWPDSTEKQARTNLRQALHHLRRALGDADRYLRMDHRSVQWRDDGGADVDVVQFERSAEAGLHDDDEGALAAAADLYRGDLLGSCYDDWLAGERARLHGIARAVLGRLVARCTLRGDAAGAIDVAERLLRSEPLDESVYRLLIDLHVGAGDRVRAVRTYHECVTVLERELGVAPDPATVARYESVLATVPTREPGAAAAAGGALQRLALVGRNEEMDRLLAAWRSVADGRPHLVLITGEPGIGKSRLVEELRAWCAREGILSVGARAYEAEGAVPYAPIREMLRADALRARAGRLDSASVRELARVLPELGTAAAWSPVADAGAQQRLFLAIAHVLVDPQQQLVLALDDVHWCDVDTLNLLESTMRVAVASRAPLLMVATARREELATRPPLRACISRLHDLDVVVDLPLERLDTLASASLAELALGDADATTAVEEVVAAAEGNPLFVVEMARSGLVGRVGGSRGEDAELPPRVQAVIEWRLDRLSPMARELATIGAVVGRAFTVEVILRLLTDEGATVAALDELWRRGIVREDGLDSYDFTHDKLREVAYRTAGPAARRRLHRRVGAALVASGADRRAAEIAHHLERGGEVDGAVDAYRRAVAGAAHVFAHQDVISSCRRALALVATRSPGPARDEAELDFLVPLGVALMAGPGTSQDEVAIYARARILRARRGLPPEPSTLRISANAAIARRAYLQAHRFGELVLARGEHERNDILLTEGHYLIGVTSFWLGAMEASGQHLTAALASNRPEHTPVHLEQFGQDPRAVCLCRLALSRYHLGDAVVAGRLLEQALEAAASTGHVYTDMYVRMFGAWLLADAGRTREALDLARGMADGAEESTLHPIARTLFGGWAALAAGDSAAARVELDESRRLAHRCGPQMFEPLALLVLGDACAASGQLEMALELVTTAAGIAAAEMPFHLAEARRRQGELALALGGDPVEVIEVLGRAADVAAGHGNVVHELRARIALLHALRADRPGSAVVREELAALCDRLGADSGLIEVAAARRALSG
jgi:DNA-binding SARP family transcriptional activator/tetratricopeptide (TPR) repeat protein